METTGPLTETLTAAAAALPPDLSPYGMFMAADMVVKAVMGGLLLASLATWVIFFAKVVELLALRRAAVRGAKVATGQARLGEFEKIGGRLRGPLGVMLGEVRAELRQSGGQAGPGLMERVRSRLARFEAAAARRAMRGTGVLATIGSTAPFVGLFGTVWGIMNAFVGISQSQTTSLAVVAPGIAEALLATATGLVAAIPAVVIYNHLARQTAAFRAELTDLAEAVLRVLSRDIDGGFPPAAPQA